MQKLDGGTDFSFCLMLGNLSKSADSCAIV